MSWSRTNTVVYITRENNLPLLSTTAIFLKNCNSPWKNVTRAEEAAIRQPPGSWPGNDLHGNVDQALSLHRDISRDGSRFCDSWLAPPGHSFQPWPGSGRTGSIRGEGAPGELTTAEEQDLARPRSLAGFCLGSCHCLQMTPLSTEIIVFLHGCRVAHLATTDTRGHPHALPICFAIVEGVIYSPIDRKPKRDSNPRSLARVRHIQANPHVCLIADRYAEDWRHLAWAQVHGTAELLDGGPRRDAALEALRQRYQQYRAMDLTNQPVIEIRPDRIVSWSAAGGELN